MNAFGEALFFSDLLEAIVTFFGLQRKIKSSFSVDCCSIVIFERPSAIHERGIPTVGHFFVNLNKSLEQICRLGRPERECNWKNER
jgi:hypothetical protein